MEEFTNRRITVRVGDCIVVTDIRVTQKVLPAVVQYADILLATLRSDRLIACEYQGYVIQRFMAEGDNPDYIKRQVADEVVCGLRADGVEVVGRE